MAKPPRVPTFIQPYELKELHFAWCYRVYYRWRTHRARPRPELSRLIQETLDAMLQPYGVHILEVSANETDVLLLASLMPSESVAAGASKIKGRVSKWMREQLALRTPSEEKLVSRGYFACTTGQSTAEAVARYLDDQGEHHGYLSRPRPPVFVECYPLTPLDEQRLAPKHTVTVLKFHLVFATWRRMGVFGRAEAEATALCWQRVQRECLMAIEKVSFVPDHVHVAVRAHPSLSPAAIAIALMNAAQEFVWSDCGDAAIQAGVPRLWQPSAYIGSYGELESPKIAAYVRRWEQLRDES